MDTLAVFVVGFGVGIVVSHLVFLLCVLEIREWVKSLPDDE